MRPRLVAVALAGVLLASCRATQAPPPPAPPVQPVATPAVALAPVAAPVRELPRAQELPAGWARTAPAEVGAMLASLFPAGDPRTFVPSAFEELSSALQRTDPIALRAVLLLARCADPLAGELLLARLERRLLATPEDAVGAAVDVAAAAALVGFQGVRDPAARLEALAFRGPVHPDLDVRVECARTALALGSDRGVAFLLAILKSGTRLHAPSASWQPLPDMGACQRRAAEALCQRAALACRYRPLAALDEREAEIRALEVALAGARRETP